MNTCHSLSLEQENTNTCSTFSLNNSKTMFKAIALRLESILSYFWDIISSSSEPRVWQERDRLGQIYWQVYDPIHNRSVTFHSEQEVRRWLEQRFYNGK